MLQHASTYRVAFIETLAFSNIYWNFSSSIYIRILYRRILLALEQRSNNIERKLCIFLRSFLNLTARKIFEPSTNVPLKTKRRCSFLRRVRSKHRQTGKLLSIGSFATYEKRAYQRFSRVTLCDPVFETKRIVAILCVITMDSDYSWWAACIQLKRNNIGSQGISDFWFAIISSKLP